MSSVCLWVKRMQEGVHTLRQGGWDDWVSKIIYDYTVTDKTKHFSQPPTIDIELSWSKFGSGIICCHTWHHGRMISLSIWNSYYGWSSAILHMGWVTYKKLKQSHQKWSCLFSKPFLAPRHSTVFSCFDAPSKQNFQPRVPCKIAESLFGNAIALKTILALGVFYRSNRVFVRRTRCC